jgi:hypothetical protein
LPTLNEAVRPQLLDVYATRDELVRAATDAKGAQAVVLDETVVHPGNLPPIVYASGKDTPNKNVRRVTGPGPSVAMNAGQADTPNATSAPAAAEPAKPEYPKLVPIATPLGLVNIMADAPINSNWQPGGSAIVFGQGRAFLPEPSNGGQFGLPLRTAAGYPLWYTKAGDGSVIGTPGVMFADEILNSDAEVEDLRRRTMRTPEQEAAIAAAWKQVGAQMQTPGGGKPAA